MNTLVFKFILVTGAGGGTLLSPKSYFFFRIELCVSTDMTFIILPKFGMGFISCTERVNTRTRAIEWQR